MKEEFRELKPNKKYSSIFNKLIKYANSKKIKVYALNFKQFGFKRSKGMWFYNDKGECISIDTFNVKGNKLMKMLAHEIGHSVLHKEFINAANYLEDTNYINEYESEADWYAEYLIKKLK